MAGAGVVVADRAEVGAEGVEHAGHGLRDLVALPGWPDPIGQQRQGSADRGVQGAGGHHRTGGDAGERDQEDYQGGYYRCEDAVVGGSETAQDEQQDGNQGDVGEDRVGPQVKQAGCQEDSDEGADQAQDAAAEGGGEIRAEDDRDGHGNPIGALHTEAAAQGVADGDADGQANGVAAGGGFQVQVGAQTGQGFAEAENPWRVGLLRGRFVMGFGHRV